MTVDERQAAEPTAGAASSIESQRSSYIDDITMFRRDLANFLTTDIRLEAWRSASYQSSEETLAAHAQLVALLYGEGWNRFGWPCEVGGLGGTEIHRAIMYEELSTAGLPVPEQQLTLETLGPALIGFAPSLAAEMLTRYLAGAEWWGQGFSETEAGSDLAALRCRATRDGDNLVVNGQKIWTSQGATATRFLCLVRTGTADSRHRGLSALLIDRNSPGVTVRPIALASGRNEVAEIFFEDVKVPLDRVVGEIDGGWAVAMHLMQWERAMYGYAVSARLMLTLQVLRDRLLDAGVVADADKVRFARTYSRVLAAKGRCLSSVQKLSRGKKLGPDSSIDKLLFASAEQDVQDLVLDLSGPEILAADQNGSAFADEWTADWWYSRAATIMGGAAEIQRGIISDHVLALPKDGR